MRLLITTQAVDLDDPVLGFFHGWITEFAKRCDSIEVICLKEGRHKLPTNVHVHSLGKEGGASRIKYIVRFYRYIWKLHGNYDAVFVHMNSEYVVLGGPLWRLWGKSIYLWRNHYGSSILTDMCALWCRQMFSTSRNSYIVRYKKTMLMPVGIDTNVFVPPLQPAPSSSILYLGRLDESKRVDVFIRALDILDAKGIRFNADIVGDPSYGGSKYAHDVRNLASTLALKGVLTMQGGVTNEVAREVFAAHAIYVNLSQQGMFDKTMLEAASSGCVVVATNDALRNILPTELIPVVDDIDLAAQAIQYSLDITKVERQMVTNRLRAFVEREHSLIHLADRLFEVLKR